MSILHAVILGIVQGLTEFLPISSSGHLLLVEHLFGINEGNLFSRESMSSLKSVSFVKNLRTVASSKSLGTTWPEEIKATGFRFSCSTLSIFPT